VHPVNDVPKIIACPETIGVGDKDDRREAEISRASTEAFQPWKPPAPAPKAPRTKARKALLRVEARNARRTICSILEFGRRPRRRFFVGLGIGA
jgi:hypothetical protein